MGLTLKQVNPAQLLPPKGQVASRDGQYLVEWSGSNCWWVRNFITLQKPQSRQVTPSDLGDFTIRQVAIDQPRCTRRAVPCYLLASDGENSAVWYSPNVALASPIWTKGAEVSDAYTQLRITKTSGTIMILTDHATVVDWTHGFDFSIDQQGWSVDTSSDFGCAAGGGVYAPGIGWEGNIPELYCGPNWSSICVSSPTFANPQKITYFNVYHCNGYDAGSHHHCYAAINKSSVGYLSENSNCYIDESFGTYNDVTLFTVVFGSDFGVVDSSWQLYSVAMHGTGINPFASPTPGTVRLSSDNGLTFGSAIDTVDNPKGFDVQRAGDVSYVGGKDALYKASTLGGSYSLFTDFTGASVVSAVIPTKRLVSNTKQTTVSDPDCVVALDTAIGGDTLFYVQGDTAIAVPITPVAGITFDHPHCIEMIEGTHIMVFGKVGGVDKLYESHDSGITWAFLQNLTSPVWITGRGGDTRASTAAGRAGKSGQLFLVANGSAYYSSKWASAGLFPRTPPALIIGLDVLG